MTAMADQSCRKVPKNETAFEAIPLGKATDTAQFLKEKVCFPAILCSGG